MSSKPAKAVTLLLGIAAVGAGVWFALGRADATEPGVTVRVVNTTGRDVTIHHTQAGDIDPSNLADDQLDFLLVSTPGIEHTIRSSRETDGAPSVDHALPLTMWTTSEGGPMMIGRATAAPGAWVLEFFTDETGAVTHELTRE